MAATKMVVKGKSSHILLKLFVLLLVVILAYGGWLYLSAQKMRNLIVENEQNFASMKASMDDNDYQAALATAREAADVADQIIAELDGIQWEIASHLPVLGGEVQSARSVGEISGSFTHDGVLPVLDAWDELVADGLIVDGQFKLDVISDKVDQIKALMDALQNAHDVSDECVSKLETVPDSRFAELNESKDKLEAALTSANETLSNISQAINYLNGLGELFSGLMGGATTTAG